MNKNIIYTIGYGNRDPEDFLYLLKNFNIDCLIDVRSYPYSNLNSMYNKNNLKDFLEENDIKYIFMGDMLGGKPNDSSCYKKDGKIDYNIVKTKDFFIKGIEILKKISNENKNIVIMCSETKPSSCHRNKLISNVLVEDDIIVKHIDENGKIKNHKKI